MSHALLIVDHGTRNAEANRRLAELARAVARERPDWLVQHAHMELGDPSFDTGVEWLVERGALEILVHLHFLGVGMHVRETIPSLVEEARARHPHVEIRLTEPLGRDPRLVDIVVDRMDAQRRAPRQRSKA